MAEIPNPVKIKAVGVGFGFWSSWPSYCSIW